MEKLNLLMGGKIVGKTKDAKKIKRLFKKVGKSAFTAVDRPVIRAGCDVPESLYCSLGTSSIFLGIVSDKDHKNDCFAGKPSREIDGNLLVIGTNGSGKSAFIAKGTLETHTDPMVVLDVKGELLEHYRSLLRKGYVKRPYIVFGSGKDTVPYDPYALLQSDPNHLAKHIRELTYALIPLPDNTREKYWIEMARNLFSGAVALGFSTGMNFVETILMAQRISVNELCKYIERLGPDLARMFVADISKLKIEHQASIATEMKRYMVDIATDEDIQSALCETPNGAKSFSWEQIATDPAAPHIFLCPKQDQLEQWSGVIRMLLTQLIRQLGRRPEKHSSGVREMKEVLVLLDELPLLGEMEILLEGLSTLRSKQTVFALMIQSLSQLTKTYGTDASKVIVENCQYKVILEVSEPDSQAYFSRLVGSVPSIQRSISRSYNGNGEWSYNQQIQETRVPLVNPEEFATNKDIWVHSPFGFFSTIKLPVSVAHLPRPEFKECIALYKEMRKDEH